MDQLKGWWKRARALVRPTAADREMTDELAFHLEMEVAKNLRAGMSPAAARRAARISFGGVERFKEEVRAERGIAWVETLGQDLRQALRGIRRAPGFAAVAILTLGLGIGASTMIFSVVDAVVFAPLPFALPDRLIHGRETNPEGADFSVSDPNYLDFRDRNQTLAGLAAYRVDQVSLTGGTEPERITAVAATHSLFSTLGIGAAIGRVFTAEEDRPDGAAAVVVLGHGLWQRAFGGDSSIVGRTITLKGQPFAVIGVVPSTFRFLQADAWMPLAPSPRSDRDDHWLDLIGRLRPGATVEQARADLARIAAQNSVTYPAVAGWGVRVHRLDEWIVGPGFRQSSLLLAGAVGILLLLACTNVANLLLARASARQTDLAVRLALGAGQGRLIRQFLTESAVLSMLGAIVGLMAVGWAVAALRSVPVGLVPRLETVAVNGRVLGFALAVAVLASVGAGILPALQASKTDVHSTLKRAGRSGGSAGRHRLREGLVVAQVALAVMLLIGGGLLVRSLVRLQRLDTGLATEHVWTVPLQLSPAQYPEEWKVARFYDALATRIEAIPGIRSAGATNVNPYSGANLVNDVTPDERAAEHPTGYLQAAWRIVSPGYFESAGVPVIKGRDFGEVDVVDGVPVAVISKTLAGRLWPGQDPIGKRLFWGGTDGKPRTVIGVVGDIRDVTVEAAPPPVMFLSTRQIVGPAMTMVVRADREIPNIGAEIRRAVWAEDANLPVPAVRAMAESRSEAIARPRFNAALLAGFATAALLLAVLGLYGVLSFAVVERTREIGVRIALGAEPPKVVGMLVGRGLLLTGLGIAIGLVGAVGLASLMTSLLYQTTGTDPLTFVAVPVLLLLVALLAAYFPASRATRVDPLTALRGE